MCRYLPLIRPRLNRRTDMTHSAPPENSPTHAAPPDAATIEIIFNGRLTVLRDIRPTLTVLDWLRLDRRSTGTKEGCAEGDCGACTVVAGRLTTDGLDLRSINACITLLATLHGQALFTVEYLKQSAVDSQNPLHPVQQSLIDHHASQCGFCTPGFVMSLWQHYNEHLTNGTRPDQRSVRQCLSGNLCRCTGYRSIIDAALAMLNYPVREFDSTGIRYSLSQIDRRPVRIEHESGTFEAPTSLQALSEVLAETPDATISAGNTDIGIWINKQFRKLPRIVSIGNVEVLQQITINSDYMHIGAAVTLERAYRSICEWYPSLEPVWQRFASLPVRNAGTLVGNLANGSPIGDSMPWLLALDARVEISSGDLPARHEPLSTLYVGYQQTSLQPGDFISAVIIPVPEPDRILRCYKLSKRHDSDISAVCAGLSLILEQDSVADIRLAWGGVAATPLRAGETERFLLHKPWQENTLAEAAQILDKEFTPMSDLRGSASYRRQAMRNLLYRFYIESSIAGSDVATDVFTIEPTGPGA